MLEVVYDIKADFNLLYGIRNSSRMGTGLSTNPYVFGSPEFWNAVEAGEIETHVLDGKISRVYWTGHGDTPHFDLLANEKTTDWIRQGDWKKYSLGRSVKLEYFLIPWQEPVDWYPGIPPVVSRISLEPGPPDPVDRPRS